MMGRSKSIGATSVVDLASLPYVVSTELGLAYGVSKLPYAVAIDRDGIVRAKGLVNSREHLESLLHALEAGVASLQEWRARSDKGTVPHKGSADD